MSGWISAAIIGAGALSGVGSFLAADSAASAGQTKKAPAATARTETDPVLAALRAQGLLGLGVDPGPLGVGGQGSPLNQVAQQLTSGNIIDTRRQGLTLVSMGIQRVGETIRRFQASGLEGDALTSAVKKDLDRQKVFDRTVGIVVNLGGIQAAGFGSVEEFIKAETDFQATQQGQAANQSALAAQIRAGREGAQGSIAQLQSDFPLATEENLNRLEGLERERQALEFSRQRDQIAEQSNVLGINPAGSLGLLGEREAASGLDAVTRALSILGGRQQLGAQGLAALQGSLGVQQEQALQAAGIQQSGILGASQLAAQQGIAAAQNDLQGQLASAQFQQQGFGSLASSLSLLGLGFGTGAFNNNPSGPGTLPETRRV